MLDFGKKYWSGRFNDNSMKLMCIVYLDKCVCNYENDKKFFKIGYIEILRIFFFLENSVEKKIGEKERVEVGNKD